MNMFQIIVYAFFGTLPLTVLLFMPAFLGLFIATKSKGALTVITLIVAAIAAGWVWATFFAHAVLTSSLWTAQIVRFYFGAPSNPDWFWGFFASFSLLASYLIRRIKDDKIIREKNANT